jgi:hypothetical protein
MAARLVDFPINLKICLSSRARDVGSPLVKISAPERDGLASGAKDPRAANDAANIDIG